MNKLKLISTTAWAAIGSLLIGGVFGSLALAAVVFIATLLFSKYQRGLKIAMACGAGLVSGIDEDCSPPVAGLEVEMWLMDRAEIDLANTTVVDRTITAIAMNSGKYAYKFVGKKTSNSSSITLAPQKYKNYWTHSWSGIIFSNTAATKKDIIEVLAAANVVAVVRNKWKGTDSATEFEVLGWDVGLEMSVGEKKSDDADTQSAWKVTMSSPKDQFESNAGYLLAGANQTAILALIEGLENSGS